MNEIAIVDFGMGNLRSVQKALEKTGSAAIITSDPNRVAEAHKLILPGVGAFEQAIARLRESGLAGPIIDHIHKDKPLLGICLGLQLLFTRSYEDGEHQGLGVIAGDVVRFNEVPGLKIPHMGWNEVSIRRPAPHLAGLADRSHFYFVHSYYVRPEDPELTACETDYPTPFTSAIWRGNLFATQFHPEKSQQLGLSILHNFATMR
jgi:glutamine amidotransferase